MINSVKSRTQVKQSQERNLTQVGGVQDLSDLSDLYLSDLYLSDLYLSDLYLSDLYLSDSYLLNLT